MTKKVKLQLVSSLIVQRNVLSLHQIALLIIVNLSFLEYE